MRTFHRFTLGLILALVFTPMLVRAQAVDPVQKIAYVQWEKATVDGAGTGEIAVTSPVFAAGALDSMTVLAEAATTGRSLVISCMAKDGTTSLWDYPAVTITAGQQFMVLLRPDITVPGTATTNVTYYSTSLCPRVRASMAAVAAGAGVTAKLAVYGRKAAGVTKPVRIDKEVSDAAGGALTSGAMDTSTVEVLQIIVEATTTNRALVVTCLAKDGTTALFTYPSLTVTAGAKFFRTFRADSPVPGTEATNVLHIPVELCPKMKASIAAAGAASAKLAVYGR